jgi:hypothetical protein
MKFYYFVSFLITYRDGDQRYGNDIIVLSDPIKHEQDIQKVKKELKENETEKTGFVVNDVCILNFILLRQE